MDEAAVKLVKLISSHEKVKQKLTEQQAAVKQLEAQQEALGGANLGRAVYDCHNLCTQLDALYEAHNFYAISIPAQHLNNLSSLLRNHPWIDQSSVHWSSWENLCAYSQRDDVRNNLCNVWKEKIEINVSSLGQQPDRYLQYVQNFGLDLRRCRYDLWINLVDNLGATVASTEAKLGEAYEKLQYLSTSDQRQRILMMLQDARGLSANLTAESNQLIKQIGTLKKSLGLPDQL